MRATSLKLPPALDGRLTELARRRRSTRSAILREALDRYEREGGAGSVVDAAGELVGSLRGPADLSASPKHMSGYGR